MLQFNQGGANLASDCVITLISVTAAKINHNDMIGLVVTSDTTPSATVLVGAVFPRGENVARIYNSLNADQESLFLSLDTLHLVIPAISLAQYMRGGKQEQKPDYYHAITIIILKRKSTLYQSETMEWPVHVVCVPLTPVHLYIGKLDD
ncbi:hypothetical protein TorRG33x02_061700 [Trema orientale]|uniref:Uncharacterized protein n=1 Tax=Trema orientale TaxID=63057 RepID=A0A2P5FK09_TREOI|nr:hypothetical protein TorRG33x02_061700 [Trema orientale]